MFKLGKCVSQSGARRIHYPTLGEEIQYRDRRYVIGKFLGKGSFGQTYECHDEWDNPLVAKIIVPSGRPYKKVLEDWSEELYKLKKLRHPCITYVYEAFEYRDTFYLIIERCSIPLASLYGLNGFNGSLWVSPVAQGVLQALQYMHDQDYVHKDVHPGNVFAAGIRDKLIPDRKPQSVVKLGDLGISRLEKDIDIFGTIIAKWMQPPEFLNRGEFGTVGKQVDIYQVGLLLLGLLLNRQLPFTRQEILDGRPRQMAEHLPSPFSFAISKALRRHVKHRTQTAIEFWRDMQQLGLGINA